MYGYKVQIQSTRHKNKPQVQSITTSPIFKYKTAVQKKHQKQARITGTNYKVQSTKKQVESMSTKDKYKGQVKMASTKHKYKAQEQRTNTKHEYKAQSTCTKHKA